KELSKIDIMILDVDMPLCRDEQKDDENYLPSLIAQYGSADDLRKIAGYQIYTELVIELGFPKAHILFCSNHADYFDELKVKFASANIKPPLSSNPEKPFLTKDDKTDIKQWLDDAQRDYFVLRRGIIEGCQQLKKLKEKLRFEKFSKEDKKLAFLDTDDYLDVLENFLPLREPSNKAALYKLFIRTLAHEWEESVEPKKIDDDQTTFAFSWIMKMTRNWMAHNSTAIFNNLTEQDIAYLFICNMRAIFDLGIKAKGYEKDLFLLFNKSEESKSFKKSELDIKEQRIPLVKYYVSYFNEKTKKTQVHHILHDLQNDKSKLKAKGDDFFITGLYHSFWFLTSEHDDKKDKAAENNRNPNQVYISRHYTFYCFDYAKSDFLLKFSSHIYNRSFPQ
ncbi:MAG: hypothetical protein NTY50_15940, partial [Methylobacter sp.]|nr:hypothetical protein [Methylobacter sp.]